jgi:hypothetical protein
LQHYLETTAFWDMLSTDQTNWMQTLPSQKEKAIKKTPGFGEETNHKAWIFPGSF